MPDLKQALRDFIATSNSGKYADEATLLSKFPELSGYNIQSLRDFVATSNSGKYANEDELFSKFPEFGISKQQDVSKEKFGTALPSGDVALASKKLNKVEKAVEVPDDYKRINSLSNKYTPVVSLDKEGKTVYTKNPEGLVEIDLFPEFTANKKKDPIVMREAASRLRVNIEEKINDINTGKKKVHYLSDTKDKLENDLNEVKALQIKANKEVWALDDAEYEEMVATERVDQSGSIAKKAFNRVMAAISPYKSIQLMSNETSYNKKKLTPEFSLGMKVLSGIEPVEYERVLSALKNDEPISSTDIANITAYGYDIKDERLKKEQKKIEDKYSSQLGLLKNDIQKYELAINNKKTLSESDIADYNSKINNYNAIITEIKPLQEKAETLRKAKEDNLLNSPEVLRAFISEDVAERLNNLKKGINPDFKSEFLFGHTWNYTDDEIKFAAEEGLKEFGIDPTDKRVVAAIKYLQDNEGVWLFQNSIAKSGGIRELGKGVSGVVSGMSNFVENLPKSEYEIYAEAKSAGSVNVAEKRLKGQDEGVIGVANDVLKGVGQFGAQAGIMYLTGGVIGAGGKAILGRAGTTALAGDIAIADMSVGNLIGSTILKAKNPLSVVTTTYAMEYDSNLKQALSYTSDNSLARNAAALNTAISSATELILSPLDIAKGIVKKFSKGETKDLLNILSDKSLKNDPSKLKSYITKAIKGVGGAGKVVVAEILEEEVVAVADYLTNQYLNPESESFQNRKLSSEMAEVAYQTGVSMALPAILNGVGSANANTFSKSSILVASQNRLKMIEGLGVSLANKNISKEEYAERVQLVNISAKANDEMPNKADGIKLNADEKANYIWSRVTESFMNDKMKATDDEAQKMILKKKIAEQQNYRAKILEGEEILVKPSYKVDDNEVSKDEFISLMDSEGSDRFRFEVTGDSEMKDKLRSEAGLQQEEAPEVTSKRTDRIAEIEFALSPESTIVIEDAEKTKLQTELETLKTEQDAIQKQTTGQVPVLTETGVSQEVPQGLSQTGLEVVTTGTQEVAPEGKVESKESSQTEKERYREQKMKEEGLMTLMLPFSLEETVSQERKQREKEVEENNNKVKARIREIDAEFDAKSESLLSKEQPSQKGSVEVVGSVEEPSIVVHGTINGYGLQYSEGKDAKDIVEPLDPRAGTMEQRIELNKGNAIVIKDEVNSNGGKDVSVNTPMTDSFGREGGAVYELSIPKDNKATAEGIKKIVQENHKKSSKSGKELINETVGLVKDYINSNKAVEQSLPTQEVKDKVVGSGVGGDEPLKSWKGNKIGAVVKQEDIPNDFGDTAPKGEYKLDVISVSATDVTIKGIATRKHWDKDNYDGYQTEQLDDIKKGFDTESRTPIIVEKNSDGTYKVIDGHHRLTIANELGRKDILALVHQSKSLTTQEAKDKVVGSGVGGDNVTVSTNDKNFNKEEFVRDIDKLEKEKANGSKNIGLYSFKDKFVKLVKSKRKLSKEDLNRLRFRVSDMDNVYPALEIIDLPNGSQAIVMDKASGKIGNELTSEEIDNIPQEHWDKFEQTIRGLSNRGIQTDLTKRSNLLYDKDKGFQFIDLEGASIEGDATNKFFKKDGKEYYYNFEKYTFFPKEYKSAKEIFTDIKSEAVEQSLTTKNKENEKVQPQRTGDGTGRIDSRKITPLEGTPSVQGINGPDAQLFAVAEQYAADNGIDLKRQGEYVEVDEERAERIANAYEEMANDPQNPKVKEAYAELIKQTIAQYKALVNAGYKFWFIDLNIPSNVEYASSPFNAMRDLRQNKTIGVFSTVDGFGTSDLDVSNNPLLEDTGIEWAVGGLDGETMMPVLANDLFRAVHDTFGHGLEGSGFRARGEENAWQAHVRLFRMGFRWVRWGNNDSCFGK